MIYSNVQQDCSSKRLATSQRCLSALCYILVSSPGRHSSAACPPACVLSVCLLPTHTICQAPRSAGHAHCVPFLLVVIVSYISARYPWRHIVARPDPALSREHWCFLVFANVYLGKGRGPARLDGLNLGGGEGRAVEAGREVVAVKVVTLGRRHGAEVGTGQTADTAAARLDGLAERPKLLGMVAVRAERRVRRGEALGERAGRRGRVRVRCVVDRSCPVLVSAALVRISRKPPPPRKDVTYKERTASR